MIIGIILITFSMSSILWLVILSREKIKSISENGYGSARKTFKEKSR